jgi:hypothetical protein
MGTDKCTACRQGNCGKCIGDGYYCSCDHTTKQSKLEQKYRRLLWLTHGHIGLYCGDDDMYCMKCRMDYKRGNLTELEKKAAIAGLDKLKEAILK